MTTYIPDPAPAAGSRARSREIGYADAMLDMYWVLQDGARYWGDQALKAAEQGEPGIAAILSSIRAHLDRYAEYAAGAWRLHADDRPPADPRSMAAVDWRAKPRHETGSFPAVR